MHSVETHSKIAMIQLLEITSIQCLYGTICNDIPCFLQKIAVINIIIIYIRLFGEAIIICVLNIVSPKYLDEGNIIKLLPSRYSKMAAKELKLLFLDFRNVYRMKLPDINNNNCQSIQGVSKKMMHS